MNNLIYNIKYEAYLNLLSSIENKFNSYKASLLGFNLKLVHPSLLKLHLNYFFLFSLFTLSMLCYNDTVILHRTSMYDAIILQILPVIVKKYMI